MFVLMDMDSEMIVPSNCTGVAVVIYMDVEVQGLKQDILVPRD